MAPREAPNGVCAVEHGLDGGSRVRAQDGATYTVRDGEPIEVQIASGALWVYTPTGGVGVQVSHGGFSALVPAGSLMVDAGEGSDGLLLVTSGEVLLVDAMGTSRVLTAGDAAVLGADGDLAGVDRVSDDELAADPWAVANRTWDAAALAEIMARDGDLTIEDTDDVGGRRALLDDLYVPSEDHEVSGRSIARFIEVAALILLIGAIVAVVLLFNKDEEGGAGTTLATPAPTSTTVATTTTTTEPAPTTTVLPPTVKVEVNFCTQNGESLVAQGTVEGAPESTAGYRITVEVQRGAKVFGSETITVERSPDGAPVPWAAEIAVDGDAVGAGAECRIPADDGVRVV